ncbi:uncharacterized protein BCR38DRAFT_245205 [Pseudomassariella vexata]|uniref:Uncharacterized protein n=1 Tax=Pseudomassariella vexata TaxID=1141098 RepID=A0A1Y2DU55_9PEZI|nr:uncharacterized protein BCR38DRAFT_245205 [Pseudomassariella vexata]ORY62666.1 hypothetical protein BCR38DRAFT_245205 [Pseudomassariella vexata]
MSKLNRFSASQEDAATQPSSDSPTRPPHSGNLCQSKESHLWRATRPDNMSPPIPATCATSAVPFSGTACSGHVLVSSVESQCRFSFSTVCVVRSMLLAAEASLRSQKKSRVYLERRHDHCIPLSPSPLPQEMGACVANLSLAWGAPCGQSSWTREASRALTWLK